MRKFILDSTFKVVLSISLLFSCTSNTQQEVPTEAPVQEMDETYSVSDETAYVKWTAYKFTEKAGVSGTFDTVLVQVSNREGSLEEIIQGTTFQISTRSVNTNMPLRDDRIYNSLFVTIEAETITGTFDDANATGGNMTIDLGNGSGQTSYTYAYDDDTLAISASIDLTAWQAQDGVDALNEACKLEHTGTDGISKLWPDVDIMVKVPLKKVVL